MRDTPPPIPPPAPAATTPRLPLAPAAILRRLEWRVRGAVENALGGEYRSAFRGRGMEFDQVVKYEFGDDVRDIDWNVTARLGEPYRKKFVEEREVTVLVVFEDTPSLQFGSGAQSRREALLELAGLLMLLGAVNRDRVGFVHAMPRGCIVQPPVRGRGAIHHAAARLFGAPPPPLTEAVSAEIPWKQLRRIAPRHSILVWLGDFAPRPAPDGWPLIQSRFKTMGFRVDDPWDRTFPTAAQDETPLVAYDPVAGRLVTLEDSAAERAAHAHWRTTRDTAWRALFPDPASRLVVGTDENRLDALVRFFLKAGSGRAAALPITN
ncbi:MAG: DUF58 domain-containing protein [Puniceicoccales bacterium]|jgi:uncharacterized protein (DUF58 family)|nr:DUF58 domain-containing protein [Puniceicoccales bacterium]